MCPQCQTVEERHELAGRVVAGIESEVARRQRDDLPPDQVEGPLVKFAMGLRAAMSVGDSPAHRQMSAEHAERHPAPDDLLLKVEVTGAFLTGHPLDVRLEGYEELRRALALELESRRWRVDDRPHETGTYESGGGFSETVPLVIARRNGEDLLPRLVTPLVTLGGESPGGARRTVEARPMALLIDVYDLGVAVLTAEFELATAGLGHADVTAAVEELLWLRPDDGRRAALVDALQKIAVETATEYAAAVAAVVPEDQRPQGWLSRAPADPRRQDDEQPEDARGRLLWLHPVHIVTAPTGTAEVASALAPAFSETMNINGGAFAAGIGSSTIAVAGPVGQGLIDRPAAESMPLRLTRLHWAYYAYYIEVDRGLLGLLNQAKWREPAKLSDLEGDADDVFVDALRISDARARLDSALSALGGDELAVWDTISRVQRFDAVVDSVERKLESLEKVAERRVALATAERARRVSNILGALTVLTVVTVAGGVLGVVAGSRSPGVGSPALRVAVVVTAAVVAVLVYWLAFVRTAGTPSRSARRRPGSPAAEPRRARRRPGRELTAAEPPHRAPAARPGGAAGISGRRVGPSAGPGGRTN